MTNPNRFKELARRDRQQERREKRALRRQEKRLKRVSAVVHMVVES